MPILVIDLHIKNAGDLFQIGCQSLGNAIPIHCELAGSLEIGADYIGINDRTTITGKAVENGCQSAPLFGVGRTFEKFIEHCADGIGGTGNRAFDWYFKWDQAAGHAVVIHKIDRQCANSWSEGRGSGGRTRWRRSA